MPPRRTRCTAAFVATLLPALAAAEPLTLEVTGVTSTDGALMIEVLASEAAFGGDGLATAALILPPVVPVTRVTVDVPVGALAVRVMHDVDRDGQLSSNLIGMPAEPWGFSNDAVGNMGPPKWQDARFDHGPGTPLRQIRLNH